MDDQISGSESVRFRGRLGRRMALVFLPLILIPLLALGIGAYLRARNILEVQATGQMTSAAQSQVQVLTEWTDEREQRLQLGSQRTALVEAAELLAGGPAPEDPEFQASHDTISLELEDLSSRQGAVLFSDLAIAFASDGTVLVSTNPDWEGESISVIAEENISTVDISTRAIYDDPLLAPGNLAFVTVAPIRPTHHEVPDMVLIGSNSGLRLGALLSEMQVFWEQRGVYRVERGRTFVLLAPDILVELLRYGSAPDVTPGLVHPIFQAASIAPSGTEEYVNPDGDLMLAAYEWLPDWNMGIVAELPQEDIFTEINDLAPFIIALIIITILLTMGIVVYVGNRMLQPLGTLTSFSARLARGEWESRVPEDRDDEIGALAYGFNRMADDLSSLYRSLEDRVEARTLQVRTASEVARAVISTPSLDELLSRAVDLIQTQFGYYHVSIFLLDESKRNAVLVESTGEVGQALIARGHQIPVGSQSVIGWVTENNEPRLVSEVAEDPVHLRNELLPGTRAELAVPLQVGGQILGALDVQSTQADAFHPQDVEVMQTLADQLSAAIRNARLAQVSAVAADRARLVSEITTDLSRPMDIEEVMENAARAIQRALGQPEVIIEIHQPESATPELE